MLKQIYIALLLCIATPVAFAETSAPSSASQPASPAVSAQGSSQASTNAQSKYTAVPVSRQNDLVTQLLKKFTRRDGTPAPIVVFSPIDETRARVGGSVSNYIVRALKSYGPVNARYEPYVLSTLTLEEFRVLMARHQADILIGLVTKQNAFSMYLYDRKQPYAIYAYSEQIPAEAQPRLNASSAEAFTRLLIRRLLYSYLTEQFFELPREESVPVLQSEIPKWVASEESLQQANREIDADFYIASMLGAALSRSRSTQWWNSNLIGLQLGVRLHDKLFLDLTAISFSYNAFTAALKYTFLNRSLPFQVRAGLGGSFVTRDKAWILDQTVGLGRFSYYITGSGALLWPIGDVYLQIETQAYMNTSFNQFIFTFMPGLVVPF